MHHLSNHHSIPLSGDIDFNIYNICNRLDSSIIYNCCVQNGFITDNSIVGPTNLYTASNINSGSVPDIVCNSFYPDEDLCYDATKWFDHNILICLEKASFPSKIV